MSTPVTVTGKRLSFLLFAVVEDEASELVGGGRVVDVSPIWLPSLFLLVPMATTAEASESSTYNSTVAEFLWE